MPEQKERPIIFSTQMVQAILEGRKTQTRRVITPQPTGQDKTICTIKSGGPRRWRGKFGLMFKVNDDPEFPLHDFIASPYGKPDDLLYVRETWMPAGWGESGDNWCIHYKANGPSGQNIGDYLFDDDQKQLDFWIKLSDELESAGCPQTDGMFEDVTAYLTWRPSIYMPKNAARIWLQVKDIRVERVQEITWDDAVSEGCPGYRPTQEEPPHQFKRLWDSINEKRGFGWDKNPYVWAIEFEVVSKIGKPS